MDEKESLALYRRLERIVQIRNVLPKKLTREGKEVSLVQEYNSLYDSVPFLQGEEIIQYFEYLLPLQEEETIEEKVNSIFQRFETKVSSFLASCPISPESHLKSALTGFYYTHREQSKQKLFGFIGEIDERLGELINPIETEGEYKIFSAEDLIEYHQKAVAICLSLKEKNLFVKGRDYSNRFVQEMERLLRENCSDSSRTYFRPKLLEILAACTNGLVEMANVGFDSQS